MRAQISIMFGFQHFGRRRGETLGDPYFRSCRDWPTRSLFVLSVSFPQAILHSPDPLRAVAAEFKVIEMIVAESLLFHWFSIRIINGRECMSGLQKLDGTA